MPPFRAEHIGSLLRPPELLAARRSHDAGDTSDEAFAEAENAAIVEAIALQEDVGLEAITDGEFRRHIYFGHFAQAVDGFTAMESALTFTDESGNVMPYVTDVVTGPLKRRRGITTGDYEFIRSHTKHTPKVTLPSPGSQHYFRFREGVSDTVYPTLEGFFDDVAGVYRQELAELAALGATYVQLDDVAFPLLCDPAQREKLKERGHDPKGLLSTYIDATNAALDGKPESLTVGMHLCRGNNQGKWLGEGGYDYVEEIFGRLELDAYFLEYDTPRAGGFEPLRFVREPTHVVLGLVTTKTPELEQAGDLLARIDAASEYIDADRLAISPQCGFASVEQGNPIGPDDQRRKLELVVEVAEAAWS
jgi:methionine synthase II (cobalamin-independent)